MGHDRRAGAFEDLQVGQMVLVDRSRYADQDEVGRVERLDPVGQRKAVAGQVLLEVLALGLQQLGFAGANPPQACGRDVDPDDPAAGVSHRDRGRQADVAEAHARPRLCAI